MLLRKKEAEDDDDDEGFPQVVSLTRILLPYHCIMVFVPGCVSRDWDTPRHFQGSGWWISESWRVYVSLSKSFVIYQVFNLYLLSVRF